MTLLCAANCALEVMDNLVFVTLMRGEAIADLGLIVKLCGFTGKAICILLGVEVCSFVWITSLVFVALETPVVVDTVCLALASIGLRDFAAMDLCVLTLAIFRFFKLELSFLFTDFFFFFFFRMVLLFLLTKIHI